MPRGRASRPGWRGLGEGPKGLGGRGQEVWEGKQAVRGGGEARGRFRVWRGAGRYRGRGLGSTGLGEGGEGGHEGWGGVLWVG